jgi:hypothetical protein
MLFIGFLIEKRPGAINRWCTLERVLNGYSLVAGKLYDRTAPSETAAECIEE